MKTVTCLALAAMVGVSTTVNGGPGTGPRAKVFDGSAGAAQQRNGNPFHIQSAGRTR